jgi:homoserine dehydrogenase
VRAIGIGLVGFGTIGTGVARLLTENAARIRDRAGAPLALRRVADVDLKRDRGVALEKGVLIGDYRALVDEDGVDVVIELVGGTTVARDVVLGAIERGRHVVTNGRRHPRQEI